MRRGRQLRVLKVPPLGSCSALGCRSHARTPAALLQNYDDHPPFDPPYNIEAELVKPGLLREKEKAAIEKAECKCSRPRKTVGAVA